MLTSQLRKRFFMPFIALVAMLSMATSASAEEPEAKRYIVVFKDSVKGPGVVAEAQTEQRDGELGFVYRHAIKGYSAVLPSDEVAALRSDPRVDSVTIDHKVETFAQTVPTGIQRALADSNADLDIDGQDDVRVDADVAIIDSGIDSSHPDLNVAGRTNCVPVGEDPETESCLDNSGSDNNSHGTHVAGTVGAIDNGFGVVGTAPGARLWAVKALNAAGNGYESWIVAGVDWVTAHASQIEVANMSLGCGCEMEVLEMAIINSVDAGVVYVVAAGNAATDAGDFSPANSSDVITVSALADYDGAPGGEALPTCVHGGEDDTLANFSNFGGSVEVAAPGVCILSTVPGNEYATYSGTSMASPHVAGAAALLASKANPNSREDVEAIRDQIVAEGNLEWTDTVDEEEEPLLDMGQIATLAATVESTSTATLSGKVKPGGLTTTYQFEYGKTTAYGTSVPIPAKSIGSGTKYVPVSEQISGLSGQTAYHYRVVATNSKGTFHGKDQVFGTTTPTVTTEAASEVRRSDAVLHATIDPAGPPATYRFEFGKTTSYGKSLPLHSLGAGNEPVAVNEVLGGIDPDTTYHFRIAATNTAGTSYGQDQTFITGPAQWRVQATPNPPDDPESNRTLHSLKHVSCATEDNCVAVGSTTMYFPAEVKRDHRSQQWDGEEWSLVPWADLEVEIGEEVRTEAVEGLDCPTANWCVAVGYAQIGQPDPGKVAPSSWPLIEHWDGSEWSVAVPPKQLLKGARLGDVSCASPTDCFAVGNRFVHAEAKNRTFALRWNGSEWTQMTTADPSSYEQDVNLYGVSCTSATSCVAVGGYRTSDDILSLAEHWDGQKWSIVKTPTAEDEGPDGALHRVSCTGTSAASTRCMAINLLYVQYWDGKEWSLVESPPAPKGAQWANRSDVSCAAVSACLIVGYSATSVGSRPFATRWNGSQWSSQATIAPNGEGGSFGGIDCLSIRTCVAVGAHLVGSNKGETLVEVSTVDAASDGDGDGHSDLVALDHDGTAKLYPGSESGVSASPKSSLAGQVDPALLDGTGQYAVDMADVTGDGRADLVAISSAGTPTTGTSYVYPGKADRSFGSAITGIAAKPLLNGSGAREPIGVADLDGDTYADYIGYAQLTGSVVVVPGKAEGVFDTTKSVTSLSGTLDTALTDASGHYFLDAIDVTGDGIPDVVSVNSNGKAYVFKGKPNREFEAPKEAASIDPIMDNGSGQEPVGLGDVTGDGRADLLTLDGTKLKLWAGKEDATFAGSAEPYGSAIDSNLTDGSGQELIGLIDYSGDGRADLVSVKEGDLLSYTATSEAKFASPATSEGEVEPARGLRPNGQELVSEAPILKRQGCTGAGCRWYSRPTEADTVGDGKANLVTLSSAKTLFAWGGNVIGSPFGPTESLKEALDPALLDGTGHYAIDVADVTGEGRSDLVTLSSAGGASALSVYPGNTNRSFGSAISTTAGKPIYNGTGPNEPIAVAEMSGDGRADYIGFATSTGGLVFAAAKADGSFDVAKAVFSLNGTVNTAIDDQSGHYFLDATDVTGDKVADVVSVNSNGKAYVFKGKASGEFEAPKEAASIDPIMDNGSGQEPVGLGDVTGDGRADLLTLDGTKLKLWAGKEDATFAGSAEPYGSAIDSNLMDKTGIELIGLYDQGRDGLADLIALNSEGALQAYLAQPGGTFAAPISAALGISSIRHNATGHEMVLEKPMLRRAGCEAGGCVWP